MRSGRPRGPGSAFKNVGVEAPHIFEGSPGPRGRPDLKKAPKQVRPDCLQVTRLSSGLMRILDFSFDGGTENVTKWH